MRVWFDSRGLRVRLSGASGDNILGHFYVSVVQRRGQWSSKPLIGVRVPAGAPYGGIGVMGARQFVALKAPVQFWYSTPLNKI